MCKEGPRSLTLHLGADRIGARRWETSLCPLASWDLTPQHFPEDRTVSRARCSGQAPGVRGVTALREVVRAEGDSLPSGAYGGNQRVGEETPPVPPACCAGNCVESPEEEDLLREVRLAGVIRCRGTRLL